MPSPTCHLSCGSGNEVCLVTCDSYFSCFPPSAITYEVIRTITAIYPNTSLIENAAKAIVRFVTASNHNWKYLGINALASLVQVNPHYAAEHQMVVIDCLDDPDETLKRKVRAGHTG